MGYSLFAIYEGPGQWSSPLGTYFRGAPLQWLRSRAGALDVDLFVPEIGKTVLFDDGPGPAALLEFSGARPEDLETLAAEARFQRYFLRNPTELAPGIEATFGLFHALASPVGGAAKPAPRTAGLSFLVRYYGPMANEAAFHRFYTANHPPLLGRFPDIRNVFCYVPETASLSGLPVSAVRLGNEVVFDDLAHLNTALQSDVLPLLKADSAKFPPFGHSTHHPMVREKLLFCA